MELRDLRVGNLIMVDGEVQEVMAITSFGSEDGGTTLHDTVETRDYVCKIEDCEPIRISVSIIDKLGLDENEWEWGYFGEIEHTLTIDKSKDVVQKRIIAKAKYLHELQNIFFVLKGEELDTKDYE